MAHFNLKLGSPVRGVTGRQRYASLPGATPIPFVVLIIVLFSNFGFATPTEAGALGAAIVMAMALWPDMRWGQLRGAPMEAAKLSVVIFTMIWGVLIYVRFLGFAKLPEHFADFIASLPYSPYLMFMCILLVYVVLGMFMDVIGMLILTLPVTFPAVIALNGAAPGDVGALGMTTEECAIWFGIIAVKMAELCLITPPIGLNCFVVAGVAQDAKMDISVQDVFRGAPPYFAADVVTVIVLVAFPGIVLFLPNLIG